MKEDIQLPKNSKLIVILLEGEADDWYALSSQGLNGAYGDKEPDSLSEVKEHIIPAMKAGDIVLAQLQQAD